jgi:hypothetical protein
MPLFRDDQILVSRPHFASAAVELKSALPANMRHSSLHPARKPLSPNSASPSPTLRHDSDYVRACSKPRRKANSNP